MRNITLVMAAVLIMVGTGLVARSWLNSQRVPVAAPAPAPVKQEIAKTEVLVAVMDIPAGTFLKDLHLGWQTWPDASIPSPTAGSSGSPR